MYFSSRHVRPEFLLRHEFTTASVSEHMKTRNELMQELFPDGQVF